MVLGQLACPVFGAGLGEPGADLDGAAVDGDRLAGGGAAALTVKEQLEELDGLGEGAASCRARGQGAGGGGEVESGQEPALAVLQGLPAGELAGGPAAEVDAAGGGIGGEGDAGFEVVAQQVVFAVPVGAVRSVAATPDALAMGSSRPLRARTLGFLGRRDKDSGAA